MRRNGAQAGQADGVAHGRAAPALGARRAVRVPADRAPASCLPLRARAQRAHPARRARLLPARRRLRPRPPALRLRLRQEDAALRSGLFFNFK